MEHRFQVNLKGLIALLSDNLYSGPRVYIRELLQNAVDAIHARSMADERFAGGRIDIEVAEGDVPTLVFQDNGIGLTEDQVHQFLATIGESSKRDEVGKARNEFIGQFGIGLLSCFMVAEEIVVITRSIQPDAPAVEWRGQQNGTYSVRKVESHMAAGTRVYLRARPEMAEWCSAARVRELAAFFGALLPIPIQMRTARATVIVNDEPPPWRADFASLEEAHAEMLAYGKRIFGEDFFDVIPLQSRTGDVDGVAFVLPYSPSPAAKSQHRVYLKNMLLSENAEGVLPDWAFFVRCAINANALRPNAAREAFYEDAALAKAREELGACLRRYLLRLAKEDPHRLSRLITLHYLAIKALAVHDDEFYRIVIDWVPFETSAGVMTLGEYRRKYDVVRYVPTVDQFRQVASVADSQQMCIINGGYTYDEDLIRRLADFFPDLSVVEVDASILSQTFADLTAAEQARCANLIRAGEEVLQPFHCVAEVVKFEPSELATLYNSTRDANLFRSTELSKDIASTHWKGILDNVISSGNAPHARLFLNYRNAMIQRLANLQDDQLLRRCIETLYVQSLLLGMHPLSSRELNLLNSGLLGLINAAVRGEGTA